MTDTTEPTTPGWYANLGGNDHLIYLLLEDIDVPGVFTRRKQWMAFTRDGLATECGWSYIAQAGPVVPIIKAKPVETGLPA